MPGDTFTGPLCLVLPEASQTWLDIKHGRVDSLVVHVN